MVEQSLHIVQLVGGDDEGAFFGHGSGDDLAELLLRWHIQPVGGLVHEEVVYVGGKGETHQGLLLVAHREGIELPVLRQFELFHASVQDVIAEGWIERTIGFHIFCEPHCWQVELFRDDVHLLQGLPFAAAHIGAIHCDLSFTGAQQSHQQVEQG